MYFVRYGDICVRFTGKGWDERKLPEFTSVYDYDDEKKYSLDDLERESRRTDFGGTGRDEDAHGPWGTVPSGPFSAVDRVGRFLPWTVGDGSFRTIFGRAAMHGLFFLFFAIFRRCFIFDASVFG